MKSIWISTKYLLWMSLLLGVVYPLIITGFGQLFFHEKANGSLIVSQGKVIGSELVAQAFEQSKYFWPRPSACVYAADSASASNASATKQELYDIVEKRKHTIGYFAPADMLYASASGLDPHITPEAAYFQAARVATARNLPKDKVVTLIQLSTQDRFLKIMGQPRVNVLKLNRMLDQSP